jgi:hypothetical protein
MMILLPLLLLATWSTSLTVAKWKGEWAAHRDVQNGHYRELGYGLPFDWRSNYATILKQRHPDAEFVPVAGCIVSFHLQAYVSGYNKVSERAALRHYGRDIFLEAAHEAEQGSAAIHPRSGPAASSYMA